MLCVISWALTNVDIMYSPVLIFEWPKFYDRYNPILIETLIFIWRP